jgi:uncharacterized protein YggT (Ycf19 family)
LLAIAVFNRNETTPDPLQKLLLLQLGRAARWPLFIQLILPAIIIATVWALLYPLLIYIGVTTKLHSDALLVLQGAALSLIAYLSLKFVLLAFLIVHLIVTYVYLGANPVWEFINTTSRNILRPLDRLPLRFGKVNLTPVIGIILVLLLLFLLPDYLLHELDRRNLTIWPQ